MIRAIFIGILLLLPIAQIANAAQPIQREIMSVYVAKAGDNHRLSAAHLRAEMPLNHLGLTVTHKNLTNGLPTDEQMKNVRGIIAWFEVGSMPDPIDFINWIERMTTAGKSFVLMGDWAFQGDTKGNLTSTADINRLLKPLHLYANSQWHEYTYKHKIVKEDPAYLPFEAAPVIPLRPFRSVYARAPDVNVLFALQSPQETAPTAIMTLSPGGGYIAVGHALKEGIKDSQKQWVLNPFRFFRHAFHTDDLPKPDTTTLSGRRIYYSHVDGDGWNNLAIFKDDKQRHRPASEYILKRIVAPYPDMPVTIAALAGELDPDYDGRKLSEKTARALFALPQVELGSHTYTHPFSWAFFEDYTPEKEARFRKTYKGVVSKLKRSWALLTGERSTVTEKDAELNSEYDIPRAFMNEPFSLKHEIAGSSKYIESLAPKGKKVAILQWSGDTTPFEAAIAETRKEGLANLNGGDSRLDEEYPSLAWVAPIGTRVGKQIQIFSSNSNENTYTDLWTGRFYGFRYLSRTVENTNTPRRIKPFNIYYHMYSGERQASLNALLENIALARSKSLTPIKTSHYARIADGFFRAEIFADGDNRWQIKNRGRLQTIRYDHATFKAVDFARSTGVIGQTHNQGSLYVALDEAVRDPVIALKNIKVSDTPPPSRQPYLIQSRWHVWDVKHTSTSFSAVTEGYGHGEMEWYVPKSGTYHLIARGKDNTILIDQRVKVQKGKSLNLPMKIISYTPVRIQVTRDHG